MSFYTKSEIFMDLLKAKVQNPESSKLSTGVLIDDTAHLAKAAYDRMLEDDFDDADISDEDIVSEADEDNEDCDCSVIEYCDVCTDVCEDCEEYVHECVCADHD